MVSAPFCFVELAALFCEVGADENVGAPVRFLRKDGGGQKCPRSNVRPETNLPHEGCREKAALAPRRSGNSPAGCSVSTIPLLSESRAVESKLKERATQTGIIVTIPHTDASFIFKKAEWSADIFVRHRAQSHKRSTTILVRHRAQSHKRSADIFVRHRAQSHERSADISVRHRACLPANRLLGE